MRYNLTNGVIFMPKGIPNKKYTGEFKRLVVETIRQQGLSYYDAAKRFDVSSRATIKTWERIYLEGGPEALYEERRGRTTKAQCVNKGRPPIFDKQVEEDLIAENQRLRAENDYLKKLNALVLQEERLHKRRK